MRSSSVEFCEPAQLVAAPEWEEGGLVLVKQTFVGSEENNFSECLAPN